MSCHLMINVTFYFWLHSVDPINEWCKYQVTWCNCSVEYFSWWRCVGVYMGNEFGGVKVGPPALEIGVIFLYVIVYCYFII